MSKLFKGVGVALVTPFKSDFTIDYEALKKLVNFQIENGTDYLVVQGTTGESPTLSSEEKDEVLRTVIQENNGRIQIVYGVGGNNTMEVAKKIKQIPAGVDGILSVSPYYNKPIQSGIIEHYKYLAKSTSLPIILYNVPGRTGSNVLPETTLKLAEIDNIVAMKEASGNMEQIMHLIRDCKENFTILSGDDALTMPLIAAGANGVISVVANAFPKLYSDMVHSALMGEVAKARNVHYDLLGITGMFFEQGNPGGVKESLAHQGIMEAHMRLPLVNVSADLKQRILNETDRILKN